MRKKYLSPKEVEAIYGLPRGTQANYRYQGIGPKYHKIGKKVLYSKEDLDRYFNENRVHTTATSDFLDGDSNLHR